MAPPVNRAAFLPATGKALEVRDCSYPVVAGPDEVLIKNAAIAINPIDWHMQDHGIFIQEWPAIIGCDVAGEIYAVGSNVKRFKRGDRVIGHAINFKTGQPQHGAFALYTVIPEKKVALLPDALSFTDGVVIPTALDTTVCALNVKIPGEAFPGVSIPTLGLPLPSLEPVSPLGKTLVVYGGSSSVGSMTIQIATAVGIQVLAIAGANNFDLTKRCGAVETFDYKDSSLVSKVADAVKTLGGEFIGIVDAISTVDTYPNDLAILEKVGGVNLACTHPPPPNVPDTVKAGMVFAMNDAADPVYRDFVTPALRSGKLQCLPPPTIVGKGLEYIQEALEKSKAGVSGTKLVVEL